MSAGPAAGHCRTLGLGLADVRLLRPPLRRRRLVLLRHVMTGLADEAIGVDVTCRSDLVQHPRDVRGVRDQAAVLHMGVGLAYQPLLIVPGAAAALTCDPLDMTFLADIVGAEGDKLALRPNFDVVVLAATGRARLAAASAFGL